MSRSGSLFKDRLPYPEQLPPVANDPGQMLRKVDSARRISLFIYPFVIGTAFTGKYVALEETAADGVFSVYFCKQKLRKVDLREM